MGNQQKNVMLKVRLTVDDLVLLKLLAGGKGLSMSDYVRRCALGRPVAAAQPEVVQGLVITSGLLDLIWKELQAGHLKSADLIACLGSIAELSQALKELVRPVADAEPAARPPAAREGGGGQP
jgi:hypothetical protein